MKLKQGAEVASLDISPCPCCWLDHGQFAHMSPMPSWHGQRSVCPTSWLPVQIPLLKPSNKKSPAHFGGHSSHAERWQTQVCLKLHAYWECASGPASGCANGGRTSQAFQNIYARKMTRPHVGLPVGQFTNPNWNQRSTHNAPPLFGSNSEVILVVQKNNNTPAREKCTFPNLGEKKESYRTLGGWFAQEARILGQFAWVTHSKADCMGSQVTSPHTFGA